MLDEASLIISGIVFFYLYSRKKQNTDREERVLAKLERFLDKALDEKEESEEESEEDINELGQKAISTWTSLFKEGAKDNFALDKDKLDHIVKTVSANFGIKEDKELSDSLAKTFSSFTHL